MLGALPTCRTTHFWGPVANWGFVIAVSGQPGSAERQLEAMRPRRRRRLFVHRSAPYQSGGRLTCCLLRLPACPPQGLTDTMTKPPEAISRNMTAAM